MLLSIVLPVYNVKKYLEECLQSILSQNMIADCEILLIDDGSTDGSEVLCDSYAERYTNVLAYHKENGGLSDARNYGLMRARGKYIFFLDSDDRICENAIISISNILHENPVDVVIFDALCIDENSNKINDTSYVHRGLKNLQEYTGECLLKDQLYSGIMQTTVWLGVYKTSFLTDHNLWFEKGRLHEDELWSPVVFLHAEKVIYLDRVIYQYRIRDNSIMHTKGKNHSKNVEAYIYIYTKLIKYYLDNVKDEEVKKMLLDDLVRRYLYVIKKWHFFDYPELVKYVNFVELKQISFSCKNRLKIFFWTVYKTIRRYQVNM